MPHQCVRCSKMYDDGSNDILKGCSCGAKLFFYVRKDAVEKSKQVLESVTNLSEPQKMEMEKDVFELVGKEAADMPVILDVEAIRIPEPGKFELDLIKLFKKDPLIYNIGSGKYLIDLTTLFKLSDEEIEKARPKSKGKKYKKNAKK